MCLWRGGGGRTSFKMYVIMHNLLLPQTFPMIGFAHLSYQTELEWVATKWRGDQTWVTKSEGSPPMKILYSTMDSGAEGKRLETLTFVPCGFH